MDPGGMLAAPEEMTGLRVIHPDLGPHGDLGVQGQEELVEVGDGPVDDGIDPENLPQLLGRFLASAFGLPSGLLAGRCRPAESACPRTARS
jgi:hypothetical protein